MRLRAMLILVVVVLCAGWVGCKGGTDKATIEDLRAKLRDAVEVNGRLVARLKQLDASFAAAVNKAEAARDAGDSKTSTNTNINTQVKLIDLNLLSPREEKAAAAGGGTNTNVNTEVKLIDLNLLSPNTNEQVRSHQTTITALSNRVAQQDQEIARLHAKMAKHGINPAPE